MTDINQYLFPWRTMHQITGNKPARRKYPYQGLEVGVSSHWRPNCLLKSLFKRTRNKKSNPRVTCSGLAQCVRAFSIHLER